MGDEQVDDEAPAAAFLVPQIGQKLQPNILTVLSTPGNSHRHHRRCRFLCFSIAAVVLSNFDYCAARRCDSQMDKI